MSVEMDTEGSETRAFLEIAGDLTGRRVLEIGCGDGRLTWRYAHLAGEVVGIDPDPDKISRARRNLPAHLEQQVTFFPTGLEQFSSITMTSSNDFDLAILAWSL